MTKGVAMANKKLVNLLLQDEMPMLQTMNLKLFPAVIGYGCCQKSPSLLTNASVAKYLMPLFREQR